MSELKITLNAVQPLVLPIAHQHALQAMLYHALSLGDPLIGRMLHENKPDLNQRSYSPFVFSRIHGNKTLNGKEIAYQGELTFSVRSCSPVLLNTWESGFSAWGSIELLHNTIPIIGIQRIEHELPSSCVSVKMLTPIVVHKTQSDGSTHYLSPGETDFFRYLSSNGERKWIALTGRPLPGKISINPLRVSPANRCITTFKRASICGWYGMYSLCAPTEIIRFLMDTGLGERNGQGFGYFNLSGSSPH